MEIIHYNTDINNWGECDKFALRGGRRYDNSYSYDQMVNIASGFRAPIIIQTSYMSESRPGAWYIKGIKNTDVTYDAIKLRCEENEKNKKWSVRNCYLIKYL